MVNSPDEGAENSQIHGYNLRSRKQNLATVINSLLHNQLITVTIRWRSDTSIDS